MTVGIRFDLPPERALEFFRKKGLNTSFAWQDMLREEHDAAFTVAKMMDMDLLRDVRELVDQAIAGGTSLRDFQAQMEPLLAGRGWWGRQEMTDPLTGEKKLVQLGSPRRIEIIYQTNLRAAYAAGHWSAIMDNAEQAPFLLYDAVLDSRTRPLHRKWDGTLLPVDHKWWETHYPPNGWRCRCSVIQMSRGQAKRLLRKDGPDRAPVTKMREWTNPRTGEVEQVPVGIDPGWNYHPGRARVPQLQQQFKEKAIPAGELGSQAKKAAGIDNPWNPGTETGRRHEEHFIDAPQWLKAAIGRAGEVTVNVGRGSYYRFGQRFLNMGAKADKSARAGAVWRHEFGHHLDWYMGKEVSWRSIKPDFTDAMKRDANELRDRSGLGGRITKRRDLLAQNVATLSRVSDEIADMTSALRVVRLKRLAKDVSIDLDELETWLDKHGGYLGTLSRRSVGRDAGIARLLTAWKRKDAQGLLDALDGARRNPDGSIVRETIANLTQSYWHGSASHVSDLFSAATNKRVEGSGSHTASYYRRNPHFRQAESWANITDLAATGDIGQRLLQDFAPGMYRVYRDIVSGG